MSDVTAGRSQIVFSAAGLIASLVLAIWFVAPPGRETAVGNDIAGPLTWPRTMLLGIACCAAVLLLRNTISIVVKKRREPLHDGGASVADAADEFDNRKALIGVAILILYVGAIPLIGFALATAGFLVTWQLFGGVRRKRVVISVSLLGTAAILYTFVKLTTLPLNRGIGVFDSLTVGLYRLLGIY